MYSYRSNCFQTRLALIVKRKTKETSSKKNIDCYNRRLLTLIIADKLMDE